MILKTKRLELRRFTKDDVSLMQHLDLDPDVVQYLGHGKIKSLEETQKNLSKILNDYDHYGLGLLAAVESATGEFVGRTGLIPWLLEGTLTWEIGYSFRKSAWGKGFATEAASALSDWAEKNLNVPYVISLIHPMNHSSMRVAEKIGMKRWKEMSINGLDLVAFQKPQTSCQK